MYKTKKQFSAFLYDLNESISKNKVVIDRWIQEKKGTKDWPIYHSLDLRISDNKICHVDSNLFPGGFHHLSQNDSVKAQQNFQERLSHKNYSKILIIIENFTRNHAYLNNVQKITEILLNATSADIKIGMLDISETVKIDNTDIQVHPILRENNKIYLIDNNGGWCPDLVLLNNDLTAGPPIILLEIDQPVLPGIENGWFHRKKSNHFSHYNKLAAELAELINIDPFFITTQIGLVVDINFRQKQGLDILKKISDDILQRISFDYVQHNIPEQPYIFLKADRGTFGMGIIEIQDTQEILNINKKNRHSLNNIKSGILNSEILIQEGVATAQTINNAAAESMLYSINGEIVGEIMRYNPLKSNQENLNSKGMEFTSTDNFDINQPMNLVKWLINKIAHLACLEENNVTEKNQVKF